MDKKKSAGEPSSPAACSARRVMDIHLLFHKLWTRDVGTKGYVKDDWKQFADMLRREGIEVQ